MLTVPFEADRSALVVRSGSAPAGVTRAQATALAHDVLGDVRAQAAATAECAGCVAGTAKVVVVRPATVTLRLPTSQTIGSRQRVAGTSAWLVAYTNASLPGCPFEPVTLPKPPATASDLEAFVITGARRSDVIAYHGAGTGACAPRVAANATFDPPDMNGLDTINLRGGA